MSAGGVQVIPESERVRAETPDGAATLYAAGRWVVPNDEPQSDVLESAEAGYDYMVLYYCRDALDTRAVFVRREGGAYVAAAWSERPAGDWVGCRRARVEW